MTVQVFSSARTFAPNSVEQPRQLLVDLRQPLLRGGVELRARPDESFVGARHQPLLLGRERRLGQRLVHGLDSLQQFGVERDRIGRRRELRRPCASERLELRRAHVVAHHGEHAHDAVVESGRCVASRRSCCRRWARTVSAAIAAISRRCSSSAASSAPGKFSGVACCPGWNAAVRPSPRRHQRIGRGLRGGGLGLTRRPACIEGDSAPGNDNQLAHATSSRLALHT